MFKHLDDVGLSYTEHAKQALGLAGSCMKAAGVLAVHAAWPDYGGTRGSDILREALAKITKADTKEE